MTANKDTKIEPEPWLRGTHEELPSIYRAAIHALELAAEDCEFWCGELSLSELNASPHGLAPVVFHLRHISRSLDRLLTYAEGGQLSDEQLALKVQERSPATSTEEVWNEFRSAIRGSAFRVRALGGTDSESPRRVGRGALPVSIGSLLVHVADHTQRHVGQAITTAKVVLSLRPGAA